MAEEEKDSLEVASADFLKDAGNTFDVMERKRFLSNPNSFKPEKRESLAREFSDKLSAVEDVRQLQRNQEKADAAPERAPLDIRLQQLNDKIDWVEGFVDTLMEERGAATEAENTAGGAIAAIQDITARGWSKAYKDRGRTTIDTGYVGPFRGYPRAADGVVAHTTVGVKEGYVTMNDDTLLFSETYISVAGMTGDVFIYLEVIYNTVLEEISFITLLANTTRPTTEGVVTVGTEQISNRVLGTANISADGKMSWDQKQMGHIYIGGGGGGDVETRWWDQDDNGYKTPVSDTEPTDSVYKLKKGAFWMSILQKDGGKHVLNNHQRCVP